jgi:hypothetical protein
VNSLREMEFNVTDSEKDGVDNPSVVSNSLYT